MKLSNKAYDILKKALTLWIPAFGTLLMQLNATWNLGLPADKILETLTYICTFVGVVFNISNYIYNKENA